MFNKLFAGCEMINCSIDCLGVCSNCQKMLKHTGDEQTDLCAMLNKMSTVKDTNILVIYNHVQIFNNYSPKAKLKFKQSIEQLIISH